MDTPETRRDAACAAVVAAGGVVLGSEPLARRTDPHVVVAYRLRVGIPTPDVAEAVEAAREETEADMRGLIPWVNPEQGEVEFDA